jgi:hypothetical protein
MTLHGRMQPVNRQAPVQHVAQVPHVYPDTGVVLGDLLSNLGECVCESRWHLDAKGWERVL